MGLSTSTHRLSGTPGGGLIARKILKPDEIEAAEKQVSKSREDIKRMEQEKENRESDIARLQKRHDRISRDDLQILQKEADAGFNEYEHQQIRRMKEQRETRQRFRDMGLDKIIMQPRLTEEEIEERSKTIIAEAEDKQDTLVKEKQMLLEGKRIFGRGLTKKELAKFDERSKMIEDEEHAALRGLGAGPVTAMDKMMEAQGKIDARRRLEDAQRFAKGGAVSSVGIAESHRFLQSSLGADGKTQEQIEDHTKGMQQAFNELLILAKGNGIKIQNGGLQ